MSAEKTSRHLAMIERKMGWFSSESAPPASEVAGVVEMIEGALRETPEIEPASLGERPTSDASEFSVVDRSIDTERSSVLRLSLRSRLCFVPKRSRRLTMSCRNASFAGYGAAHCPCSYGVGTPSGAASLSGGKGGSSRSIRFCKGGGGIAAWWLVSFQSVKSTDGARRRVAGDKKVRLTER